MGKAELATQPEMENILASIKKAIHEETGAALRGTITEGESGGAVFSGSMKEMRVRVGEESTGIDPSGEILDLRNKITTQLSQHDPAERYTSSATRTPSTPRPGGFAGLLSGASRPAEPQHMRRIADPIRENAMGAQQRGQMGSLSPQDYQPLESSRDPSRYSQHGDWDRHLPQGYAPPAEVPQQQAPANTLPEPSMMSGESSAAASAAFGRLGETLLSRALNDRPIEELTRELLRTMLKQWLDDNLPEMVERLVREEIARVARRGGR